MRKKKHVATKSVDVGPVDPVPIEEIRQLAVRELFESPEPAGDTIFHLVGTIENLPPASATRVLLSLVHDGGNKALPLLEQLAQAQKPSLALAAIQALGTLRSLQSVGVLAIIAESDPSKDLRKAAKRSLFRLRDLGVAIQVPAVGPEEAKPRFPVLRTILSSFDGLGNRGMIMGVERPFGGVKRIICFLNAFAGLIDCRATDVSKTAFEEEVEGLVERPVRNILWAEAPLAYCQHLVQEALSLNARNRTAVPRGYFHYSEEIGRPDEQYDRPLIYREISALVVKWEPTLLEQSSELLDRVEFVGWMFDLSVSRRYYFELQQSRPSALALPGWSQKQREEAVLRRFFEEFMQPSVHAGYKRQMEEMAYVFLRHDRLLDAKRALAVAVAMDELHEGDLVKIPFLRGLLAQCFALVERELRGERKASSEKPGLSTSDQFLRR